MRFSFHKGLKNMSYQYQNLGSYPTPAPFVLFSNRFLTRQRRVASSEELFEESYVFLMFLDNKYNTI